MVQFEPDKGHNYGFPLERDDQEFARRAFLLWWAEKGYTMADPESVWLAAVQWAVQWRWG